MDTNTTVIKPKSSSMLPVVYFIVAILVGYYFFVYVPQQKAISNKKMLNDCLSRLNLPNWMTKTDNGYNAAVAECYSIFSNK